MPHKWNELSPPLAIGNSSTNPLDGCEDRPCTFAPEPHTTFHPGVASYGCDAEAILNYFFVVVVLQLSGISQFEQDNEDQSLPVQCLRLLQISTQLEGVRLV
ncbi:MAG: hypothetical protein AAFO04_29055 [Cyanobacteria bacterium J06592_8]